MVIITKFIEIRINCPRTTILAFQIPSSDYLKWDFLLPVKVEKGHPIFLYLPGINLTISLSMKYILRFSRAVEKLIEVEIETESKGGALTFQLPYWRPGRYTQQTYARNVSDVTAYDHTNQALPLRKVATHSWEVNAPAGPVTFRYTYFADQLDAGGCYLDPENIYVNGICLFMFREEALDESCELELDLPESYQLAGSLSGTHTILKDFHELVDTPFFAAADLQHHQFEQADIRFHIWFMGDCKPEFAQITHDFQQYTAAQLALFGEFPVEAYHYLVIMRPGRYRHGVEHQRSTVVSMGPGYELMQASFYRSFLEICSHELFHTWNVKALRPADMFPYRYDQPNYSRLHYVTEGITTYYGDLMIWKGGGWSISQWLQSLNGELRTHFGMGGKDFTSLEAASFNSWVNGYTQEGAPNRRISFYTKGYLISFLIDFRIRQATQNTASLDDVIRRMYQEIAKAGRGYTREDYLTTIESVSGISFIEFFDQYIAGTEALEPILAEAANYYGLSLAYHPLSSLAEAKWGIKTKVNGRITHVNNLLPESPAQVAGLSKGDELVSIESVKIEKNLEDLLYYFRELPQVRIHYFRQQKLHDTVMISDPQFLPHIPFYSILPNPTPSQVKNLQAWQRISPLDPASTSDQPAVYGR